MSSEPKVTQGCPESQGYFWETPFIGAITSSLNILVCMKWPEEKQTLAPRPYSLCGSVFLKA